MAACYFVTGHLSLVFRHPVSLGRWAETSRRRAHGGKKICSVKVNFSQLPVNQMDGVLHTKSAAWYSLLAALEARGAECGQEAGALGSWALPVMPSGASSGAQEQAGCVRGLCSAGCSGPSGLHLPLSLVSYLPQPSHGAVHLKEMFFNVEKDQSSLLFFMVGNPGDLQATNAQDQSPSHQGEEEKRRGGDPTASRGPTEKGEKYAKKKRKKKRFISLGGREADWEHTGLRNRTEQQIEEGARIGGGGDLSRINRLNLLTRLLDLGGEINY